MIRLNLLPQNLRRRVEPGWWRPAALLLVLSVVGVLGFIHYSAVTELALAQSERDALRAEVAALRPFILEQNRLRNEEKILKDLLVIRENLAKNAVPWSSYLASFINQIPKDQGRFPIALRSVRARLLSEEESQRLLEGGAYDGKRIRVEFTVEGEALNRAAVIRFIEAFENSPRFGIEFQGASLQENGLYSFRARVGVAGGERGAR